MILLLMSEKKLPVNQKDSKLKIKLYILSVKKNVKKDKHIAKLCGIFFGTTLLYFHQIHRKVFSSDLESHDILTIESMF